MRRVVITGLGVVAPNGIGKEEFWDSLISGRSGIGRITSFDTSGLPVQIAGEVKGFDPTKYMTPKRAKVMTKVTQFAVASAKMAVEDAGLEITDSNREEIGVCFGNICGRPDFEEDYRRYLKRGYKGLHPLSAASFCPHSLTAYVSTELGIKGVAETISSGCTAGLDAIIWGFSQIRKGMAKVVISGGADAFLSPFTFAAACASGNLSRSGCRPYDLNHDGIVLGEGGAAVVLEDLENALSRGANIYAEILGFGWASEGGMGGDTSGEAAARAIKSALSMAGLDPTEIDYINSHGNGMPHYDLAETRGFKLVFGDRIYNLPVSSIKPITGQAFSATGVYQVISVCMTLKTSVVPPTLNHEIPDSECDLDYVPGKVRKGRIKKALVNAQNFGTHTVLILGRIDGAERDVV